MIGKLILTAIIIGGGAFLLLSDNFEEYISLVDEKRLVVAKREVLYRRSKKGVGPKAVEEQRSKGNERERDKVHTEWHCQKRTADGTGG